MNELGRLQNTSTLKYILLYCPPIFLKGLSLEKHSSSQWMNRKRDWGISYRS